MPPQKEKKAYTNERAAKTPTGFLSHKRPCPRGKNPFPGVRGCDVRVGDVGCVGVGGRAIYYRRTKPMPSAHRRGHQSRHNPVTLCPTRYLDERAGHTDEPNTKHLTLARTRHAARSARQASSAASRPELVRRNRTGSGPCEGGRRVPSPWVIALGMRWHDEAKIKIRITLSDFSVRGIASEGETEAL